jgi:hypothetical protein
MIISLLDNQRAFLNELQDKICWKSFNQTLNSYFSSGRAALNSITSVIGAAVLCCSVNVLISLLNQTRRVTIKSGNNVEEDCSK